MRVVPEEAEESACRGGSYNEQFTSLRNEENLQVAGYDCVAGKVCEKRCSNDYFKKETAARPSSPSERFTEFE